MTATIETPTNAPDDETPTGFWTWRRALGATVFALFAAMWVYVFAFSGDYQPAGWLTDRTFPTAAEEICSESMTELDALPPAHQAKDAATRAATIDRANAILRDMQGRLRAIVPVSSDTKFIEEWIDDYSVFVADRVEYARKLRTDPGADFLVTKKYGAQISRSLDNYANVNKMPSCVTPGDV